MEERSNIYEMIIERLTAMLGPQDYNDPPSMLISA